MSDTDDTWYDSESDSGESSASSDEQWSADTAVSYEEVAWADGEQAVEGQAYGMDDLVSDVRAAGPVTAAPAVHLVSVERVMRGPVRFKIDPDLDIASFGRFLFENDVPDGVEISIDMAEVGRFEVTGITWAVLSEMRDDVANRVAGAPEVEPESLPARGGSSPGVPVEMDEDEVRKFIEDALHKGEYLHLAEVVGMFAAHGSKLALVAEVLGPVGMVISVVVVVLAVIHAFGAGRRVYEMEGLCYGVMWEVFGVANQTKNFTFPWVGDEPEELREAFYEGVAQGREKGKDPKVHNAVILSVAYRVALGTDEETAKEFTLNDIWTGMEHEGGNNNLRHLEWPTPEDQVWPTGFGGIEK